MNCKYCGQPATTKNIIETSNGVGKKIETEYACQLHRGINKLFSCRVSKIRTQEYGHCRDDV